MLFLADISAPKKNIKPTPPPRAPPRLPSSEPPPLSLFPNKSPPPPFRLGLFLPFPAPKQKKNKKYPKRPPSLYSGLYLRSLEALRRASGLKTAKKSQKSLPGPCAKSPQNVALPSLQKNFVNIFFVFAWEFCIEKWRGFLVNFFWSPSPAKRSTKSPRKFRGKFGAKFGAKFGTRIRKIREIFVLQLF